MAISITQVNNSYNALVTITAGTPIPLASGSKEIWVNHILVQMLAGGSKKGLLYRGFPPNTAAASIAAASGQPVQLAAASQDGENPGGAYEYDAGPNGRVDLRTFALDGDGNGDTAVVDGRLLI